MTAKIGYSLYARSPQGGQYRDEVYADPRGAANAAIIEFDSHPETVAVILTRIAVEVRDREVDNSSPNGKVENVS